MATTETSEGGVMNLAAKQATTTYSGDTPSADSPGPGTTTERSSKPAPSKPSKPGPRAKLVDESRYNAVIQKRARALLAVDNISVSFDGFKALNNLTLILDEGELRCIIGPNGAGKTTLQDVITGKTRPDEGHVFLIGQERDRRDLTHMSPYEVAKLGIGRKFQRPTVFQGHSVFENLELALKDDRSLWHTLFKGLAKPQRERIDELLELIGLQDRVHDPAGLLSHGQKQWLEIGMLLAQNPKVLLVDEPVAGMTHQEVERTAELLNKLAGEHTVVVVEHDMEFVRSIARTVTVLHEGSVLAEGTMDEVQANPKVIEVYLGE
jgi:urea transport system ATP-binding protein